MKQLSRTGSIFAAVILSLTLVLGSGASVFAAQAGASDTGWAEEIPALLAAGNYVEGEVIAEAVLSGDALTGRGLLAGGEEVMDVTEAEEDLLQGQVPDDGQVHLVYIQRDDLTTEQILNRLAKDKRVLYAEPNYLMNTETAADEDIDLPDQDDSEEEKPKEKVPPRTENICDLTPQQWSSSDKADYRLEGDNGNSIHVLNFDEQTGNMEGDPVVIAVLDSALDFKNPDLAPVAYTFTEEQRRLLGCDVHGYNATESAVDGILTYFDEDIHGTHCAGIIGAAWDGKGISGVASNVKLVSVQNCEESGYTSLINTLRGLDFIDRANELGCNISLTSNSWTVLQASRSLNAALRKLGEKWGIVSCFAAGNESRDNSTIGDIISTLSDNPYVIITSAMDMAGNIAPYSNFGKLTVDVGAPGSGILSTINVNNVSDMFIPDALPAESRKVYEGFETGATDVKISWLKAKEMGEDPDDYEWLPANTEVTDASRFAGNYGLKINLSKDMVAHFDQKSNFYFIGFEFGDISGKGVVPGDYFGISIGGKGGIGGGGFSYLDKETGKLEPALTERGTNANRGTTNYSDGWVNIFMEIPETADLSNFKVYLTLNAGIGQDAIWIDSLGIGSEKVPYMILDGTSMACPALCGFAAVLKSQNPDISAMDLVSLVKAKVRPNASIADLTKTGGIIDFNVDGTAGSEKTAFSPSIQKVTVSGKTITLTGRNFGKTSASAVVSRIVAGKDPEPKAVSVSSWADDKVVLSLAEEASGVLGVEIVTADGRFDTNAVFVSKSENLFEEDLPMYRNTGDLFVIDASDAYETQGPIVALDQKLYYLPSLVKTEETPAFRPMLCYDTVQKTWSVMASLPEWLWQICAVSYDNKIIVKGCTMLIGANGSPLEDENASVKVYVYDTVTGTWSDASVKGVDARDTLANNEGQLILVGGGGDAAYNPETGEHEMQPASIRTYELDTGAGKKLANMSDSLFRPLVACKDGTVYVLDDKEYVFERVTAGKTKSEVLKDALPEYLTTLRDISLKKGGFQGTEWGGVLVPVKEGILFLGPAAADGSGDTYLLKDGGDKFETYEKRMSDMKVNFPAAADCNGYVYAIGTALFEKGQTFFRRTAFNTVQTPTIELKGKSAVYTGKNIDIGEAEVKEKDDKGKITYLYYTDQACTKKTEKHADVGTYYVKARIAADGNYSASLSPKVKLTIKQAANPLKVSPASKTIKQSAVKQKAQSFNIKASGAEGKVTYTPDKKAKAAKIKVTSKGKVTVPKNCKKGTYKITVKAAGNTNYKAGSETVTIRVK